MKTKLGFIYLAAVIISGLLASCSTSHQVASNFCKRKYTKGFFFNRPGKYKMPDANKATASLIKAKPAITSTAIAANKKESMVGTQLITQSNISSSIPSTITDSKKISLTKKINNTVTSNPAVYGNKIAYSSPVLKNQAIENSIASAGGYHAASNSCKSWIAALLLCFFLGGLGIHRFYLGYTWQGVVQLLTGGGCGIWALIDFIRIIMKTLPPKDGSYCD
jgi:hypothetical protein